MTRARLLASATAVFAERGFNDAAVEDIAERAGFTRGAVYANFADKADLLLNVLEEDRTDAMEAIAQEIESTPDDQKLAALHHWYGDGHIGDRRLARATAELMARSEHSAVVRERLARQHAITRSIIARVLEGYRRSTGIELALPDLEAASIILAIGEGIASQRRLDPDAVKDDAFATAVAHLWFGLLSVRQPFENP